MTYKEFYLSLKSPEEIEIWVNADLAYARTINADRIPIILRSAEEALKEKFDIEVVDRNDK